MPSGLIRFAVASFIAAAAAAVLRGLRPGEPGDRARGPASRQADRTAPVDDARSRGA